MSTVLITGGSRGIGAATARLAAERGHDVCLSYRGNNDAADQLTTSISAMGRRALAIQADAAHETEVDLLFETAIGAFGSLDAVIVNAGILETQMRLDEMSLDRWKRVFDANVFGAFLTAKAAVKHMSTRHGGKGGAIVFVSSRASVIGSANEFIDYAASKGAVDTMTIGLAREVAREAIRVNAVRPGLIETDIHVSGGMPDRVDRLKDAIPMARGGSAEEVAETILWLASEDASYVTGALLDVSGGR